MRSYQSHHSRRGDGFQCDVYEAGSEGFAVIKPRASALCYERRPLQGEDKTMLFAPNRGRRL